MHSGMRSERGVGMQPDEVIEHVVALAAGAAELTDDIEERVAALGLEPTLRDRTLLLIEQTRMLVERSTDLADDSHRLRAIADQQASKDIPGDHQGHASHTERFARREATADARDEALQQREETADRRDDTLTEREVAAGTRERHLDDRERAADLSDDSLRLREQAVAAHSQALNGRDTESDEFTAPIVTSLAAAVERGWRTAQQTTDPSDPDRAQVAALDAVITEIQQVVPEIIEQTMTRWVGHAYHELRQPLAVIGGVAETLSAYHRQLDEDTLNTLVARYAVRPWRCNTSSTSSNVRPASRPARSRSLPSRRTCGP